MPEQKMPVQLRALIQQRDGLAQACTNLEFQVTALQLELQDLRQELEQRQEQPPEDLQEAAE